MPKQKQVKTVGRSPVPCPSCRDEKLDLRSAIDVEFLYCNKCKWTSGQIGGVLRDSIMEGMEQEAQI
jgi:hypothetical protein